MVRHARPALDAVSPTLAEPASHEARTPEVSAPALGRSALALSDLPRVARDTVRVLLCAAKGKASPISFYAALRRIECRFRDLPRLGEAALPGDEPVRLAQDPALAFRASALTSVSEARDHAPARVGVGFFGAFGPHGPLPTHLTEYAFERGRHHGDGSFVGFLDMFHHRLLSLLYRGWADAQPTVSHDRPEDDAFARRFGALLGLATGTDERAFSEVDFGCLYTAQHFSCQTRHPEGLRKVLRACFGVEVTVQEFVGRWLRIPDALCWRLPPSDAGPDVRLGVLGHSSRVGSEFWDQQSTFGVTVGPLSRDDYERFLPGGRHLARLLELVERYAGPELRWSLRLVLREPERRPAVLGVIGATGISAHLAGGDGDASSHFEDLVLDPSRV
jgi:type VI secretion system protein ImpH